MTDDEYTEAFNEGKLSTQADIDELVEMLVELFNDADETWGGRVMALKNPDIKTYQEGTALIKKHRNK